VETMAKELYFLMDLERTLTSGCPCYWKGNRYGYTYRIDQAGIFNKDMAEEIVKHDHDEKTIMISLDLVEKTLALDLKQHEG
jgi:hypothetical protein